MEKLKAESDEILKKSREKRKLYEDKRRELILQIQELEQDLGLECSVDMEEFYDQRKEIDKKIEEIKKKIEPKKEEVILKAAPKSNGDKIISLIIKLL